MRSLPHTIRSARERIRNRAILLNLRIVRSLFRERAVPLSYWIFFRSIFGTVFDVHDPVFPPHAFEKTKGSEIGVPELSKMLKDDLVGLWTLDKATLEFLWKRLLLERPRTVIECGAGLSTLMLAVYSSLPESVSCSRPSVLSLEQDQEVVTAIRRRLKECHLADRAHVFLAPLSEQGRYMLKTNAILQQWGDEKADWLLIDGPAGPDGCRRWTLPELSPFCRPSTRWFLDDAFRDGELSILKAWSRSPGIEVQGILPIGKGLGTGIITKPEMIPQQSESFQLTSVLRGPDTFTQSELR